jgi:plastocyanin
MSVRCATAARPLRIARRIAAAQEKGGVVIESRNWRARRAAVLALACTLAACSRSDGGAPHANRAVTPVDPTSAGSIQVQVNYTGPPPTASYINMSGTPACAALHPQPVAEQSLVVNDGHLANALVYIKSGFGDRAFAVPDAPVVIDQKGCLYAPHVAGVMVGQPLQFVNSDQEAHNVHGRPREVDAWNFLISRPGASRAVTFTKSEVGIPVGCDIHPWMRAYVSVLDNPYFAVTGADGAATLRTVPAGSYVVAVWHETLGTLVKPVTVRANEVAPVQFDFRPPS